MPWTQLALFELPLEPSAVAALATMADTELLRYCDEVVRDHARAHGWTAKQTNDVRRSLRLVQVLQHTPNAKINASDVLKLPGLQGNVSAQSTIDVLAAAGLLVDDRMTPVERYFNAKVAGLPATMTTQLRVWFGIMIDGSPTAPRRRPRDPATARLHIRAIAPILRGGRPRGTTPSPTSTVPTSSPSCPKAARSATSPSKACGRSSACSRPASSCCRSDPRHARHRHQPHVPLPLDTDAIRAALDSPHPASAFAVALVAFHALTGRQLRALQLTDIADGRLSSTAASSRSPRPCSPARRLARLPRRHLAEHDQPAPVHQPPHRPRLTPVSRPFPGGT